LEPRVQLFDPLLNNNTRYVIVAHLARNDGRASFGDTLAAMTLPHSGMLSQHARRLEAGGYIRIKKSFKDNRRPHTELVLTDVGRRALADHMAMLAAVAGSSMMESAS
jgi:DNA-binding MarR family transcriptional regulator